jgi:hypothetical protein
LLRALSVLVESNRMLRGALHAAWADPGHTAVEMGPGSRPGHEIT